jgi:hypothetical protein
VANDSNAAGFDAQPSNEISFTASDLTAVTTTCSVDGGAPLACSSPFDVTGLSQGAHAVAVTATDRAGNVSDKQTQFRVDTIAPVADFTGGPKNESTVSSTHPTFSFGASDASSVTFSCALDGRASIPCVSPFRQSKLVRGAHFLSILPTDAAGNTGAAIARLFTVVPVKRCVKHKVVRSTHRKLTRVCSKYRLATT